MKRITNSYTSVAASVTGFASNVTADVWALTANVPGDDLAHKLTIKGDAATDHSAKTAVIVGLDENGAAQSETVNLPNGVATVTSTKYWSRVTSVTPSATIGLDTMDIGWAAESVAPWIPVANFSIPGVFNLGFVVKPTAGAPTYTVQSSYDDSYPVDHATVAAIANAVATGAYTAAISSMRVKFTAAGALTLTAMVAHL
jgi:hypothetical protein